MERKPWRGFPRAYILTKPTKSRPGSYEPIYQDQIDAREAEAAAKLAQASAGSPAGLDSAANSADAHQGENAPGETDEQSLAEPAATTSVELLSGQPQHEIPSRSDSLALNVGSNRSPDFSRHSRQCTVCSHPDRDLIEADFIRWRSPDLIAKDHQIARISIYRHVHAMGLFKSRKRELNRAMESIIENAEDCTLEWAHVIVQAARVYSHIDDDGKWSEPPRTQFIFAGPAPAIASPESLSQPAPDQPDFAPPSLAARAKRKRPSRRRSKRYGSTSRK
jgi:hypothetical protein